MTACIHAYTTADSLFLVVKWAPGYVNSLTTATLYSPMLTLFSTCLLLFAWIRTLVFDQLSSLLCSDLQKLPLLLLRIYTSGECHLHTRPFALNFYSNILLVSICSCLMTCSNVKLKRSGANPSPCFKPFFTLKKFPSSVSILTQANVFYIMNLTNPKRFSGILNYLLVCLLYNPTHALFTL